MQERGRRRRAALLGAAVELLEEGGFSAVSHRAVADRAGLPLAATTYYFRSRDDLVAAALERLIEADLAALRRRFTGRTPPAGRSPRAVAAALVEALLPRDDVERVRQLALWELYLQAGRTPALQPLARAWTDGCHQTIADLLRDLRFPLAEPDARLVGSVLDALQLEALIETRPNAVQTMVETVTRVLSHLKGA